MCDVDQRHRNTNTAGMLDELRQGREAYRRRAWADAYRSLSRADIAAPLGVEDLQLLASSAYLIGREDEYLRALDRAHHALLDAEQWRHAARCALWIGLSLLFRGETGPATGWFGRCQRLIDREGRASAEEGYLLLPRAERELAAANWQAAYASAATAVEIGERFGEPDLIACARHLQGRALLQQGHVEQGLALLDEAMVAVVAGELSPLMTGLIYCSVIDSCMQVYALVRARDWTFALSRWCEGQPQLVSFAGTCLVHRAEIMELHGAWTEAIEDTHRACLALSPEQQPPAVAFYRRGELYRLRGEFAAAEAAYRDASRRGFEPQPGLAQLRMAQGRVDAAAAAIRRAVSSTTDRLGRTRLLPACIEIMLATGDVEGARTACRELEEVARIFDTGVLGAMAAHSRGSVALADGEAAAAVCSLRNAFEFWQNAEAPYPAARARELLGLACRALGDEDGAGLELEAAKVIFQRLGAAADLDRVASYAEAGASMQTYGLTKREQQVLRLVAAGKTNKAIASELFVSQRTIDRHVSNLLGKLDLASRAAAIAFAHKHKLI